MFEKCDFILCQEAVYNLWDTKTNTRLVSCTTMLARVESDGKGHGRLLTGCPASNTTVSREVYPHLF